MVASESRTCICLLMFMARSMVSGMWLPMARPRAGPLRTSNCVLFGECSGANVGVAVGRAQENMWFRDTLQDQTIAKKFLRLHVAHPLCVHLPIVELVAIHVVNAQVFLLPLR